jgi:chromosomal replication initiator protein
MKAPWFHIVCEMDAESKPAPTIRDIQSAVCGRFAGITVNDINSDRRPGEVIMPRHVAMYLARHLTLKSYPAIGRAFGDRDHTTVLSGIRKIERLAREDGGTRQLLASIRTELGCAA